MAKKVTFKKKNMVILRENTITCTYCEKKITDSNDCTVDHVLPKAMGGKTQQSNLTITCRKCNNKKGQMDLMSFLIKHNIKVTKAIDRFL